ncbi:hypothetical protein EGR52_04475 [bacterium]|nr:hypothetical protein [bacterium]
MENLRRNKGITLVALVITIIILLILAGISIQAITNKGLFVNAKKAKEKSMEGQLKEEITLAIQSIQTEEIYKGNSVTLETLAGGQLEKELKDITAELTDGEINGEYKDYEYTIDSNLNVTINGPVTGVRIKGSAEVQTGYVFEGSTVEIKVTASVTEGTITGIEAPEGTTLKKDTSTTEKVYTVNRNGAYTFKIISDAGKTKNITAKVENILSAPQITISEVKKDSFKINVENDYPEGAITEYKYSVGGTVKQQGTTDKNYTVTGLTQKTKYSNIKVTACINSLSKDSNVEEITTKDDSIEYSWEEIAEIAKAISNETSITDDTETATVTVNGVQKTLNVGDTATLEEKKVRILGFNHDELAEPTKAYGSSTATGKAGISFEYVDFLTSTGINSSDTNSGGWNASALRGTLNGTTYNSLSIKNNIKKVKKDYIPTYNVALIQQTEDYLWLLSCGEIWDNGFKGGVTRGYAITTEGKQYKYYKMNLESTKYDSQNDITKKTSASNSKLWWLRSPGCTSSGAFCYVFSSRYLYRRQ